MAGLNGNEGAVISRDRWGTAHIDQLSDERWYIAQTNDDHWTGVCVDRCISANANMQKVGQKEMSLERLKFDVLFQEPNYNELTLYQSMMVPSQHIFSSVLTAYPVVPPRGPVE